MISDLFEAADGLLVFADSRVKITNLVEDRQVLRVFPDDLFIFGNRARQSALLDTPLRLRQNLCFVESKPECHSQPLNKNQASGDTVSTRNTCLNSTKHTPNPHLHP